MKDNFSAINESKANFDEIYLMDDPRAYFSVLGALDYMIPDVAEPIVRQILSAKLRMHDRAPLVLDIGCSYGINAAVHRFPLNFDALRRRYTRHEMCNMDAKELAKFDTNFFKGWPDTGVARFLGLDISEPAIRYARSVGLIENGIATDLEAGELTPAEAAIIRPADVLLSTGSVGYVTERTYGKVLKALERTPWVISFVLRMFPYDRMAEALSAHGLVTERLNGATFVQRRFRDVEEFEKSLEQLRQRGVDPTGFESEGLFQADLFVSRPAADIEAAPLDEIVTVTSGRSRPTGARYVQVESGNNGTHFVLEP